LKEKKKVHRRALKITSYHIGRVQPYTPEIMAESKAKMEALAQKDRERQLLEAAKNKVESYIYKIKNKLIDDEENINKVSTEEQREEISKLATGAEEWLYDDGYDADLPTMEDKYAELSAPAEKIFFRVAELTARPAAVLALKEKLNKIVSLMTKWETTHPQVTEDERKDVLSKVEEIRTWLAEKEAEQDKLSNTEEPVLISEELPFKTKVVESIVARLSRKPKPKPPKKEKKEDGNETKAENETVTEDPIPNESQTSGSDSEDAAKSEDEVSEGEKETVGVGEEL
jgi:hypoxia up-regulated 1